METLQNVFFVAPVLLYSVIAHEYAHGYAALRQGDPTALQLGRLTWNPVKHIDPFLTVIMPLMLGFMSNWRFVLGGAKPVPVNPNNYRNYRRGDIIVSLAGVATNFVIAIGCTIVIALAGLLSQIAPPARDIMGILQIMLIYGVLINMMLIAFNLIPIPPLDGSHVMKHMLPEAWAIRYQEISRYGIIILVLMLAFGRGFLELWMRPANITSGFLLTSVRSLMLPRALEWFR